jgi:predicted restriction endonuclease
MAAFNAKVKEKIVRDRETQNHLPCVMCGTRYPLPDAVHLIDKAEWKKEIGEDRQVNGIPLCPNCHRVFDEVLRPYLYRALESFGAKGLPQSWKGNNKLSVTEEKLNLDGAQNAD